MQGCGFRVSDFVLQAQSLIGSEKGRTRVSGFRVHGLGRRLQVGVAKLCSRKAARLHALTLL